MLPPTKEIQTLFTAVADWLHSLFSWGLQETTSDMPSWRFSRTGFDGTLGIWPGVFKAQGVWWSTLPGQGVPVEPNREDPVHAARSCFLTCRSCYSPAKVWLSRFLTLLFRTESTNVTFTPPDIVPGCHIMYNISMLSRACWLLLWFCTGSHADIMEKLVDKKQTVLDFMKAVNLLVKMKSGFTVFWGQLLTRFSRSRRQLTVHP